MQAADVITFWFETIEPKQWWVKDTKFDQHIAQNFGGLHRAVVAAECSSWRADAEGSLAEIIVLDQFSRNMFRDTAQAFAYDPMALALAQVAIEKGFDQSLPPVQRSFLYMPFMHSESAKIHQEAVVLFESLGNESNFDFELKHKAIIDRFGRYPHRNTVLGRESTEEELEFLKQAGSSF